MADLSLDHILCLISKRPHKLLYPVVRSLSGCGSFFIFHAAFQRIRPVDSHIFQGNMYGPADASLLNEIPQAKFAHLTIQVRYMLSYVKSDIFFVQ